MGYLRRTFIVAEYLRAVRAAAQDAGFRIDEIQPRHYPLPLLALRRTCPTPKATLHLSAGMHGDEPAGPLAILKLLKENAFPQDMTYVILPLLNPIGMSLNRRENGQGLDINRDYKRFATPEACAHRNFLNKLPRRFDLSINLHEDWESLGCYIYELNMDMEKSLAPRALEAANRHVPVDRSPIIDGHAAENGIIRPVGRPSTQLMNDDYPESLYMIDNFTRHSYTFETPSNGDLLYRVRAHMAAVKEGLTVLRECGDWFEI